MPRLQLKGVNLTPRRESFDAIEIASRIVAFTHGPIEVRQVMDAPPEV